MKKNILRISLVLATMSFPFVEASAGHARIDFNIALSTNSPTGSGTVYATSTYSHARVENNGTEPKTLRVENGDDKNNSDFYFKLDAQPNSGYHFVAWYNNASASGVCVSSDPKYTFYAEGGVQDPTPQASVWGKFDYNTYTVTYASNGGVGTAMASSSFTYLSNNVLRKNTFTKNATITYNTNGGNPISPSSHPQTFKNWSSSLGGEYADEANLRDLVTENNATVTLTAQWNPVSVTLPTPTKTAGDMSVGFRGWYDAPSGGRFIGWAGNTVQLQDGTVLYALWDDGYDITIKVKAEGFAEGQTAVFTVVNSTANLSYTIPVTLNSDASVTLSGVPAGSYTVSATGWNWDFKFTPAIDTKAVSADTEFSFTVKSKGSNTVHGEQSKKNVWNN